MDGILFDWMGVIFKEADVIGGTFARVMLSDLQKSSISMEGIWRRYYPYSEGKLSREDFWQGFHGNIGDLERKYLDTFELNEEYEFIRGLERRFKLGVVSNLPAEWGDYLIAKYRFRETFDPIVVSGSVRRRKPDPEIYRIALAGLGPVDDMYVVDDKLSNLRAVHELFGWKTVWMTSRPSDSIFAPMFAIDRLSELGLVFPVGLGKSFRTARVGSDKDRRSPKTRKQDRKQALRRARDRTENKDVNVEKRE